MLVLNLILPLSLLPHNSLPPSTNYSYKCLTHDVCAERNRLSLPAVVVEGQVPGTGVQVLDKHRLIEDHSLDTPPLPWRLHHAPLLLPIQALHIVVLWEKGGQQESSGLNGCETDSTMTQVWSAGVALFPYMQED